MQRSPAQPLALGRLRSCLRVLAAAMLPALLLLLPHSAARADRVVTTDGRVIEGFIVHDLTFADSLTIAIGHTRITLPTSKIESIVEASPAENKLLEARDAFDLGNVEQGVLLATESLDQGADPAGPATLLTLHGDSIARELPNMTAETRERLTSLVSRVEGAATGQRAQLLVRLVELNIGLDRRDQAQSILDLLGPTFFGENPELREQLARSIDARIERASTNADWTAALADLSLLARIYPEAGDARRTQVYLQWASALRDNNEFEQAIQIYAQYLLDDLPAIAQDRIRVALEDAERHYRLLNQYPRAAELWERHGMRYIPEIAQDRLASLWRDQGWRLTRIGEHDAAREALNRVRQFDPNTGQADLLKLDYFERRDAIQPDDVVGHYELGLWALEHDLRNEALHEFHLAKQGDLLRDNALAYIDQIVNQQAEEELLALIQLYENGKFVDVLNGIYEFNTRGYSIGFVKQAHELEQLTQSALVMRRSEPMQQAEAMFQQAQRAYFRDDLKTASDLLQTLLDNYRDTIVYPRARAFYNSVKDKLVIAELERGRQPASPLAEDASTTDTQTQTAGELDRVLRNIPPR